MENTEPEQSGKSDIAHSKPTHDEIARRAHQLWEERGRPDGSSDVDWYRAEHELRQDINLK